MLEEIRIRDLGVIEEAVLEFAAGLTVVTGETGAGKTMVVQGLGLLLGGRADVGRVRPGAPRALVEGRLAVDPGAPAGRRAVEAGAQLDDGALLVTRTVSAEGRSRAHVGGAGVPVALLAELADDLVAVHGQSDQRRLLRPGDQRSVLDRYAGADALAPLERYVAAYARLGEVEATLADLRSGDREREQQADLLRFGLAEIAAAAPTAGEDAALAADVERLANADALRTAATVAHDLLAGDPGGGDDAVDAATLLGAARRALEQQAAHDAALAALAGRVSELGYLLTDTAGDLASYAAGVDADPAALAAAQDRQSVLTGLTRKYGADVAEVLRWAADSAGRLADLAGNDDRVEALGAEAVRLRTRLARDAGLASAARQAAAACFADAVAVELADLAMPHAAVRADITQTDDPAGLEVDGRRLAFGRYGVDEVELLLVAHPGAPARPLARAASGGELSRVMLAVEVVLAAVAPVATFVFDEVDAGVGGRAAVEVGRRLARLAESAQVVVVTHLPQVAAYADRHLLVEKTSDGRITRSGVVALDDAGRVRELSRMLAGQEGSALARGHAEELLAAAAESKVPRRARQPAAASKVPR